MDVFVEWPAGPDIVPRIVVIGTAGFDEIDVQPCLGRVYRHVDASALARTEGRVPPPVLDMLSPAQRTAAEALAGRWPGLETALAEHWEGTPGVELGWSVVEITSREEGDVAVVRLAGMGFGAGGDEWPIAAWVVGSQVRWAGAADRVPEAPGAPSDPTPPRPDPRHVGLSTQQCLDLARAGSWQVLQEGLEALGQAVQPRLQQLVHWLGSEPDAEGAVERVAALVRALVPTPSNYFRPALLDRPERLTALIEAGLVWLEPRFLHELDRPDHLAQLVALGVPVDAPLADDPRHTPLVTHRDHAPAFRRLLELGAQTDVLSDGRGGVRFLLGPQQRVALRRVRPDLHVPDPPEALLAAAEPDAD